MKVSGEHHNLRSPARAGDVGYDICIAESRRLVPNELVYLRTGVRVAIPEGLWGRISGRSSTMRNKQILVVEGIIDTGYRGELIVGCINMGVLVSLVFRGDRLAQLVLYPVVTPELEYVDQLEETERGQAGFGSTG